MKVHTFKDENFTTRMQLEIAGAGCLLSTNREVIARSLSQWCVQKDSYAHELSMQILVDEALARDETAQPQFRGREHFVFGTFHGTETIVFDLLRKTVTGVVSRETASNEAFWNHTLVPIAMGVLGCTFGVVPLHSACLSRDGKGILIAGLSGAGKSTLAVALAKRGLRFVSDDWTYLRIDAGKLLAHGLSVPAKLLPDAVQYFSDLKNTDLTVAMDGELAYLTDISKLGASEIDVCQPTCLFFLERKSVQHVSFERLEPRVAEQFFTRSGERLPDRMTQARENRNGVITAVSECDTWLFRYGGSPQFGAEQLCRFIEENYGDSYRS